MNLFNFLGNVGVLIAEEGTWGQKLWEGLQPVLIVIFSIVGAAAVAYSIFLGVMLAKAEGDAHRRKVRGRIYKTVAGLFIIVILMVVMLGGFLDSILVGTKDMVNYSIGPVDFAIGGTNNQLILYRDGVQVTEMGASGAEFRVKSAGDAGLSVDNQGKVTSSSAGNGVVEFLFKGKVIFEELIVIWTKPDDVPLPTVVIVQPPERTQTTPGPLTPGSPTPGSPAPITGGTFSHWPVISARGNALTSDFGYKSSENRYHAGIDIGWGAAKLGQSTNVWVYAAHNGTVSSVSKGDRLDYWSITIRHEGSYNIGVMTFSQLRTNYIHVNDIRVSVGQKVSGGQAIARVAGSNGHGPHLHFEVTNGGANNPKGTYPGANRTLAQIANDQRILHPHILYPSSGLSWAHKVPANVGGPLFL